MKHKHLSLLDVFGEPENREPNPKAAAEQQQAAAVSQIPLVEAELHRTQAAINTRFGLRTMDTSYKFLTSFTE